MITATAPVERDNKRIGVVGNDFSLKIPTAMINAVDLGPKSFVFLVNKGGKILIHKDQTLVDKSLADAFPIDTPAIASAVQTTQVDGATKLVSFVPVEGLPVSAR